MSSAPSRHHHHSWNEPDGPDDDTFVGTHDLTRWDTPPGRALARAARRLWDAAYGVFGWAAPRWVMLTGLAAGLLIAGLMAGGTAEVYKSVAEGDGVAGLDDPALQTAVEMREPALTAAVQFYTGLGATPWMPVLATVVAVAMAWRWRSWSPVLLIAITGAGSLLMVTVGKAVVGRVRPPLSDAVPPYESSFSFPSGHSLNSIAIAGIVAYLLLRKLRRPWSRALALLLAGAFALLMGLSRVYLGHHWLTDVFVAWTLGIGWLALVVTGHRLWLTLRRRGPRVPVEGGDPDHSTP